MNDYLLCLFNPIFLVNIEVVSFIQDSSWWPFDCCIYLIVNGYGKYELYLLQFTFLR